MTATSYYGMVQGIFMLWASEMAPLRLILRNSVDSFPVPLLFVD